MNDFPTCTHFDHANEGEAAQRIVPHCPLCEIERLSAENEKLSAENAQFRKSALQYLSDTTQLDELVLQLTTERDALRAENERLKNAIDNELVSCGSTLESFNSPRDAIRALIDWHTQVSLDPAVSTEAAKLRNTYKAENDALRAALFRIASPLTVWPTATDNGNPLQECARAALGGES